MDSMPVQNHPISFVRAQRSNLKVQTAKSINPISIPASSRAQGRGGRQETLPAVTWKSLNNQYLQFNMKGEVKGGQNRKQRKEIKLKAK